MNAADQSNVMAAQVAVEKLAYIDLGTADAFAASLSIFRRKRFRQALAQARSLTRAGVR